MSGAGEHGDGVRDDVLEANLVRLFRSAWHPVVPDARFAAALRARVVAEVEARRTNAPRLAAPRAASVPAPVQAFARRLRTAAAVLALVAGAATAWFLLRDGARADTADPLLAAGQVAVLDDPDATSWRAATERELARGVDVGARGARVATPEGREIDVHLGSSGRVEIASGSALRVGARGADGARELAIEGRAARVQRDDAGAPWSLATPDAVVTLARGILVWAHSTDGPGGASSFVELAAGIAWVASEERAELTIGTRAWLANGRVVVVGLADPDAAGAFGGARKRAADADGATDDAGAAAAEPAVAASAPAAKRTSLLGTLAPPPGSALPPSFRVTLLRRVRLPDISEPEMTAFAGAPAFAYESLRAGTYDVYVEAPGFAVARRLGVEVADGSSVELAFPLRAPRVVQGLVRDAASGAPIAGAIVLAEVLLPAQVMPFDVDVESAGWRAATRTRADGTFALDGLDESALDLRVSARGFGATWVAVPADDGRAGERALDLGPIDLRAGGSVEGRVLREDGSAWPGAIVIVSRMSAGAVGERMSYGQERSGPDGAYRVADLPSGEYVVFAFDPARPATPATRDLRIDGAQTVHFDLGPTERRTRVVGTLRDARGAALAGWDVMLGHEGDGTTNWTGARTDEQGRYAFEGVDPRTYEVFAGRGLGQSFVQAGELTVTLAPELRHDVTVGDAAIRGRVLGVDGEPARGVWVILLAAGADEEFVGRAQTDAAGAFELLGVPPGPHFVTAHDGRPRIGSVRAGPVDAGAGEARVELRFVPGVELRVRALDSAGKALAGRAVHFTDERGVDWQFGSDRRTDAQGLHVVPGLAPGRWRVAVDGAAPQTLDLELGERRDMEFRVDVESSAPDARGKDGGR